MRWWSLPILLALAVLAAGVGAGTDAPGGPAAAAAEASQDPEARSGPETRGPQETSGAPEAAGGPAQPPNIVLITTDDQTVSELQHMPYTRQLLGEQGVRFTDAVSTFPLCCPARATLLTGQHAHNHRVLSNAPPTGGWEAMRPTADTTLPVWLQREGYRTTFAGKFLNTYGHDDPTEVPPGWDDWHGIVRGVYAYNGAWVNENGTVVSHVGEYQADVVQDVTEAAIREGARTGRSFFVWQSNLAPHSVCRPTGDGCRWGRPVPAEQDRGDFEGLRPLEGPRFDERVVVEKSARIRARPRIGPAETARLRDWGQARIASLQAVDRNVRDTVELLRASGELDNTLLIFASDNGFALGDHRWTGKTLPFEPILTVPLLMRGPGLPQGTEVEETVSLVDVAATIADAADATPLRVLDGVSLLEVANGTQTGYAALTIEAGPVFANIPDDRYAYHGVRTSRYTYVRHPATGGMELYDRRRDPQQLVNVAYRPTYAATLGAMQDKLALLRDCVGAECRAVSGDAPPPRPGTGTVHPDELAASAEAQQLVTITAARAGAHRGVAVAWQRHGRQWRVARGPVPVRLGGAGLGTGRAGSIEAGTAVAAGVREPAVAFGRADQTPHALSYRELTPAGEPVQARPRERPNRALGFLSDSVATWRPGFRKLLAEHPERFTQSVALRRHAPPGQLWSPRLATWLPGVPASVGRGSLLLHTGDTFEDQGWVAMARPDLAFLLDWAAPGRFNTKIVVGAPTYLRTAL